METVAERIPTKGLTRLQHRCYTSAAPGWRAAVLMPPLAGLGLVLWSNALVEKCPDTHLALAFGLRADRVRELTAECSANADVAGSLMVDMAAAVFYGIGLSVLLLVWWRYGWRSGSQRPFKVARAVSWLPLAAGASDVIENAAGLTANPTNSGLDISEAAAQVAATAGVTKWLLLVASLFAVVLTLYGAWRFRALCLTEEAPQRPTEPVEPPTVKGAAVCLSGGGIRSAAFSWGALAQLSATGIFPKLRSMYSVSGGGYAATAWTSSAGFTDPAHFFTVDDDSDPMQPPATAFQHVRRNHRYLDSRRGGISKAVASALLSIAVNLSVIYAGIIVAATLPALLSGSRFGAVVSDSEGAVGAIRSGAWLPVLWLLALAVLVLLASWWSRTVTQRRPFLIVTAAIAATAVAVMAITIALPWMAHRQDDLWRPSWWATVPAAVTWALGLVVAFLRPRLSTLAIRLGGVVGVLVVVYTLLAIMRNAVVYGSKWKLVPRLDAESSVSAWLLLMAIAIAWLVAIDHTGVQWWSLHPLYRDRLATAFTIARTCDGTIAPRPHREWPRWSQLAAVDPRPTPNHVVCAATHRRERNVTGLRAVSYRFSRQGVSYFEPCLDGVDINIREFRSDAVWLDQSFGLTPGAPAPKRGGSKPYARSTAVAAAAMSGAAFNSVMGRQSKGSTDSLLAMLNLRLGVWMPNHRFATHPATDRRVKLLDRNASGPRPFPRPGLRYLFHEVVGHYDLADPFIQVSDGGHWENLGLAEALRDRHRTIIVVDASGGRVEPAEAGPAGTGFASLHEASDVARIEMATEVRIDVDPMRPDPRTGRSTQNWAQGEVVYHRDRDHDWRSCGNDPRCPKGVLLFVKAVVCDRTPAEVLAYANTDRVFPDYPTGDQFLDDGQFDALVRLGRSAMADAVKAHPVGTSN